ncbi:hypothetical protein C8J57DRAFT_1087325, partial [Mycena rebaudengoi]
MEPSTTLSLSPAEQRARLERLKDEISRRRSDIELLEAALDCIKYPVLTLPPEILSRIFVFCLPTDLYPRPSPKTAPLLVAQICGHWREIALETSELW